MAEVEDKNLSKEELKKAREEMFNRVNQIIDAQDKPEVEKLALKEVFTFMDSLPLDHKKILAQSDEYKEAGAEFNKDRTKPEVFINRCRANHQRKRRTK